MQSASSIKVYLALMIELWRQDIEPENYTSSVFANREFVSTDATLLGSFYTLQGLGSLLIPNQSFENSGHESLNHKQKITNW